ncbi:MAG: hypothetical protein RLZZ282_357 [Verrucomicrobiota bacterium]
MPFIGCLVDGSGIDMKKHLPWVHSSISFLCAITAASAAAVETPTYKVDPTFVTEPLAATPVSIAMTPQDQIQVLLDNGSVITYDATGKKIAEFASQLSIRPSAMTLANGKTYLLSTKTTTEEVEFQGKKRTMTVACGASCAVYSTTGTKESEYVLPEVSSATDAHFIGDALAVADYKKSQIAFFNFKGDKATLTKKIEGEFRLCCGIFDFSPTNDGDSILVANLGAFKVQTFTNRKKRDEFGARGTTLDDYHGCCNPVNVAALGTGFIVTVEKSPTRVKICDRKGKGAKIIDGLGELVNGCSTIPVAVNHKGAIFLASTTKSCIIKCVSDAPPAGISSAPVGAATQKKGPAELSDVRTWQDAQTGNKVTGRLISFDEAPGPSSMVREGKIRLLVGQKTFDLPLTRLIPSDQEFVENLRGKLTAMTTP